MDTKNTILIVEDEMIIAANISMQLTNLGYEVIGIIPRGEEVLPYIKQQLPDIILMDINLKGDLDGIDLAQLIHAQSKLPIIFLTANAEEASFNRAKGVNPYAFITKPFKKLDLQRAIELTVNRINLEKNEPNTNRIEEEKPFVLNDCIFIRGNNKMIKIVLNDILFIEAERNYCKIKCKNKDYLLVTTLKELEEKLIKTTFLRVHRSFLINLAHIDEIGTSHVVIDKITIPISAEARKQLLLHIQKI